jgi:hypothetical protein
VVNNAKQVQRNVSIFEVELCQNPPPFCQNPAGFEKKEPPFEDS